MGRHARRVSATSALQSLISIQRSGASIKTSLFASNAWAGQDEIRASIQDPHLYWISIIEPGRLKNLGR
jgi:hypothetical protein